MCHKTEKCPFFLGRVLQNFDYSKEDEKEFTVALCSPSGQSFVVGSFDRYVKNNHLYLLLVFIIHLYFAILKYEWSSFLFSFQLYQRVFLQ